jgi:glycerol-3-phosphate acyltransferase PlsY
VSFAPSQYWLALGAVLVIAYLIGGVPWALIIGKNLYRTDPREHGSGNLGATNVLRVLGAGAGALTLALDASKGALAVLVARAIVPAGVFGETAAGWTAVGAMMAAVLGHSYSPYIRFRGGKGVATSAGALLVLTPLAIAIELVLFVIVVGASRMVSLASVVIAVVYPFLVLWLYPGNIPLAVTIFVLATLVVVRHQSNIRRIARGTEPKVSFSRRGEVGQDHKGGDA